MHQEGNFYIHKADTDEGMLWYKSSIEEKNFREGINGAFLLFPFQCDLCWFRNLENRDPRRGSFQDDRILDYIRRVNLDGIWSRSRSTIMSVRRSVNQLLATWQDLGVTSVLPQLGPWPVSDNVGFRLALGQIKYSQKEGINCKAHLQYDTVRRLRTAFVHLHDTASDQPHQLLPLGFRTGKGEVFKASVVPTDSKLFTMFNRGMLLRMGKQTQTDLGLDVRVLKLILRNLKEEIQEEQGNYVRVRELLLTGTLLITGFVLALRGNECLMVDAGGLINHLDYGRKESTHKEHIVVPLLGKFKGEDGSRLHLMVSVNTTRSGLEVRAWIEYWVSVLKREGRLVGPAFCKPNGELISVRDLECEFHNQLERIQGAGSSLLESDLNVRERYSIYRSLRRGSTARAVDMKVSGTAIDLHNRWRSRELRKGQRSSSSMRDYYTDLALVLNTRLEYSRNL